MNDNPPMATDLTKTIVYWMESAAYDLETGKTLLRSKRYPYEFAKTKFSEIKKVYQWLRKKSET